MNNTVRDITHNNVEKLLAAIYAERAARVTLQTNLESLQGHIQQLTTQLNEVKATANAAFALSQGGSSTTKE